MQQQHADTIDFVPIRGSRSDVKRSTFCRQLNNVSASMLTLVMHSNRSAFNFNALKTSVLTARLTVTRKLD